MVGLSGRNVRSGWDVQLFDDLKEPKRQRRMNGIRAMGTRQKPAPFLLPIFFLGSSEGGDRWNGRSVLEKREVNAMGVRRDFLMH